MATGTSVKFDASHHAVVVFLGLGAILVLPLARMPLLKLYCQRATSVLPSCVCYLVGPHLYSKRQLRKNHHFGTARKIWLYLIVDLTFHSHWHICQVQRQPSCSGSFAWLGSHPSLATRKDATVEVVLATCHKCSSKLCLLFGPFGPTSLQQKAAA